MGLLNFNDSVNRGEVSRTCSGWVHYVSGLGLIAWDVEIHENEIESYQNKRVSMATASTTVMNTTQVPAMIASVSLVFMVFIVICVAYELGCFSSLSGGV